MLLKDSTFRQLITYLKPIAPERFHQAISKFKNEFWSKQEPSNTQSEFITIRADRKSVKVKWRDIQYVESFGDYLKIHLKDQMIITRETISRIEKNLPEHYFLRIHRSFLVLIEAITAFTKEKVELGKTELVISRTYKTHVANILNESS